MKDIDTISRELSKKMRGLNDHEDNDFTIIKSALTAVRNEALEHAANVCADLMMDHCSPRYCSEQIRALKLPSER